MDSTLPLIVAGIVFVILGILMVLYGIMGDMVEKRKSILKRVSDQPFYKGVLDQILDSIDFIIEREKRLDKKMAVLDVKYTARTLTKLEILGVLVAILISIHLKNILVVIPLSIICANLPVAYVEMKINNKIRLFDDQVLEALQLFITEYTTTKSVQKTIVEICPKLKYPLRREFELLARKLNSGANIEESFLSFAERTQNKWLMVFSQMMITYFRLGGDFTPHLLSITQNITNEKILNEQNNTELVFLRWLNIAMNALVPVAYISNRFVNPQNANVFVETPLGRMLMFAVVTGSLISLYLGKKISEA